MDMESKTLSDVTSTCSNTCTTHVVTNGDDIALCCSQNLLAFLLKRNTNFLEKYKGFLIFSSACMSNLRHHFGVTHTMCGSFVFGNDFVICSLYSFHFGNHLNEEERAGPKVIKLFSCSTQLSMKFQLLIRTKIQTNIEVSCFKSF